MIPAYHIMKLLPREQILFFQPERADAGAVLTSIRQRWEFVQQQGVLVASQQRTDTEHLGRLFREDQLAGDDNYVFLSATDRFLRSDRPETVYGWIFDANELLEIPGVFVADRDLMTDYIEVIGDIIEQFSLQHALDLFDVEDAAVGKVSPLAQNLVTELRNLVAQHLHDVQRQHRRSGEEAVTLIRTGEGNEILVPHALPLTRARGTIEAGAIHIR